MTVPIEQRNIGVYLEQLASKAPTPGGGSVAGLVAALAMSLGRMVVSLSESTSELKEADAALKAAGIFSLAGSDADERAYGGYIAASSLPRSTPEEKAFRRLQMQASLLDSAEVPLGLAEHVQAMKPILQRTSELGNPHVVSDARIGLILADAAIAACLINVRINLPMIKDPAAVALFRNRLLKFDDEQSSSEGESTV
ncbi:MAG: cyclodeaminase/cyclohydrolase family protein [Thermomicrobiales bacterium]